MKLGQTEFTHLHNHLHTSLLDGFSKPELFARAVAESGMTAAAITDHGSLAGAFKFREACLANNIKPIIGCEFYVAPESLETKSASLWGTPEQRRSDVSGSGAYCHLTVLARNSAGLRKLFQLQQLGGDRGFYRKPRIDLESLTRLGGILGGVEGHDGSDVTPGGVSTTPGVADLAMGGGLSTTPSDLIVLSGCASGHIATRLRLGQVDQAHQTATLLASAFPDTFFVEIMDHGIDFEQELNAQLLELARHMGLPLVATNDTHYTFPSDVEAHDALLHIQSGGSFKFNGDGYWVKPPQAMAEVWPTHPEALANTMLIADMVEDYDEVFTREVRMPKYDGPLHIREAAMDGLEQRLQEQAEL